jgi:hypothetical protein
VSAKIRGFLLQHPKPTLIRLTSSDRETEELKPGRSFAKLAETIAAIGPDLIECLDNEKHILRALRLGSVDAARSDAAEIPEGIKADPQALMLTHFANLIHRAYEHSTEVAFDKLTEVMERMNERSDSIEQRLERTEATNRRLIQEAVDDAYAHAQEIANRAGEEQQGGDLGSQMFQAFVGGTRVKPTGTKPTNGQG